MGFSLNNLTLFGLVLAIGIVVDDAIVVLENIERLIATGLDSRTATIKAMEEITGPILAITLVLSSVFIPCCFLGGITGQFFRQFAVTIAVSTIISAINALTMTPSRAVMIFKTEEGSHGGHELKREALPWWIFGIVGGMLTHLAGPGLSSAGQYRPAAGIEPGRGRRGLRRGCPGPITAAYFAPGASGRRLWSAWCSSGRSTPSWAGSSGLQPALRPDDRRLRPDRRRRAADQRARAGGLRRPAGPDVLGIHRTPRRASSRSRTRAICCSTCSCPIRPRSSARSGSWPASKTLARETPGVEHTVGVSGQSLLLNANAPNLGSLYVMLEEFRQAARPELTADAIAAELQERCQREVRGAIVSAFGAPPIDGLGTTGGFKLIIEDRGNLGLDDLQRISDQIVERGNRTPGLAGPVQQLAGQHALAVSRHRPDQVHGPGRAGQRALQHACRSTWARTTSTTSTSSAGPGR